MPAVAEIVHELAVSDGYDVTVTLDDGRLHVFHLAKKPADVLAKVSELAAALPDVSSAPDPTASLRAYAEAAAKIFAYLDANPNATGAQLRQFIRQARPTDVPMPDVVP